MNILFLDASGDPGWPSPFGKSKTKWYVLAGMAIEENRHNDLEMSLEGINKTYFDSKNLNCKELKYSSLNAGKMYPYDKLNVQEKQNLADDIFKEITSLNPVVFAVAIDKGAHHAKYNSPYPPDSTALRFILPRYEKYLKRTNQTGIIIADESSKESDKMMKILLKNARSTGVVLNSSISPDPYRTDTRLPSIITTIFTKSEDYAGIQYVDFIAYGIWIYFEHGIKTRVPNIKPLFDKVNGKTYGFKKWP